MQPQDLATKIAARSAPTVIDVRSGMEFRTGHIPGAIHAPAWKILLRLAPLPSDKGAELVVTCEHGPRAQLAQGALSTLGYRNVTLLDGHMAGWRQAGRPQEKG